MSYLQFLIVFLVVPIAGLLLLLRGRIGRVAWRALALIMLVALAYTAPWDNAIVRNGVWSFGRAHVLNIVIGVVPIEEYVFYLLQVALTGLFTLWLLRRRASNA